MTGAPSLIVRERHGNPINFKVASGLTYSPRHQFHLLKNGVWLTSRVLPDFLNRRFSIS